MSKEEVKQYLRKQINSCVKIHHKTNKDIFHLSYNKSYLRALKLSTITGKPVNKKDFKEGEMLFGINTKSKKFWYCSKIDNYLYDNFSNDYIERTKIIEEVFKEYNHYYWL